VRWREGLRRIFFHGHAAKVLEGSKGAARQEFVSSAQSLNGIGHSFTDPGASMIAAATFDASRASPAARSPVRVCVWLAAETSLPAPRADYPACKSSDLSAARLQASLRNRASGVSAQPGQSDRGLTWAESWVTAAWVG